MVLKSVTWSRTYWPQVIFDTSMVTCARAAETTSNANIDPSRRGFSFDIVLSKQIRCRRRPPPGAYFRGDAGDCVVRARAPAKATRRIWQAPHLAAGAF